MGSVALPFTSLRLRGPKPRVFPRGYPHTPRTLGERIRQRRMDLGLTQRTLALELGVGYPAVAAWESGASEPLAARWPAIEVFLGPGLVPEREGLPGRLRAARQRLGLTQQELAELVGIHVRTVRNVEVGTYGASRRTVERLTAVFGPTDPGRPVRGTP